MSSKFLNLSFFICFCFLQSSGQSLNKKQSIYVELGGNGFFTSVNYDVQVSPKPGLGIRAGIGFYKLKPFALTIPIGVNYLFEVQRNTSFMEVGLGTTWSRANASFYVKEKRAAPKSGYLSIIPSIGYRRHTKKALLWRLSLTPVINENGFIPFFGGAFGKLF
ncbi:MAG: hypothetical protein R2796_04635 [Chitinophagaceae bacterium]|nr:hypothetical protein [Chitinophagaceae bacterium]MCB0740219.1 hypothetical protein [Chitinophagaceae bacterium]HQV06769.1 hypothetical protein [Chitinophagaceae bacterium]